MHFNKIAMLLLCLAASPLAMAQDSTPAKPDFFSIKQNAIQRLTNELNCVQAAKDEQALQACRPRPPQGGPGGNPPPRPPN